MHSAIVRGHAITPHVFEWGRLYWYVSAEQGNSEQQTLGRCVIQPGQANPLHYHPNCEESLYLLSGQIEHYVAGEGWVTMASGDTITIPANVWHQARNIGACRAEMMICFSSADRQTVGESDATPAPEEMR